MKAYRKENRIIDSIIRVNQAGEYGAIRIYSGQLKILKNSEINLEHMKSQEQVHLDYFNKQIAKRNIRPTLLQPFWHVSGAALGVVTALLGKKAAMTATVAVEEAIDEHYTEQIQYLESHHSDEKDLIENIKKFKAEELEHKDIAIQNKAEETFGYEILKGAIKCATKIAIKVAKRV